MSATDSKLAPPVANGKPKKSPLLEAAAASKAAAAAAAKPQPVVKKTVAPKASNGRGGGGGGGGGAGAAAAVSKLPLLPIQDAWVVATVPIMAPPSRHHPSKTKAPSALMATVKLERGLTGPAAAAGAAAAPVASGGGGGGGGGGDGGESKVDSDAQADSVAAGAKIYGTVRIVAIRRCAAAPYLVLGIPAKDLQPFAVGLEHLRREQRFLHPIRIWRNAVPESHGQAEEDSQEEDLLLDAPTLLAYSSCVSQAFKPSKTYWKLLIREMVKLASLPDAKVYFKHGRYPTVADMRHSIKTQLVPELRKLIKADEDEVHDLTGPDDAEDNKAPASSAIVVGERPVPKSGKSASGKPKAPKALPESPAMGAPPVKQRAEDVGKFGAGAQASIPCLDDSFEDIALTIPAPPPVTSAPAAVAVGAAILGLPPISMPVDGLLLSPPFGPDPNFDPLAAADSAADTAVLAAAFAGTAAADAAAFAKVAAAPDTSVPMVTDSATDDADDAGPRRSKKRRAETAPEAETEDDAAVGDSAPSAAAPSTEPAKKPKSRLRPLVDSTEDLLADLKTSSSDPVPASPAAKKPRVESVAVPAAAPTGAPAAAPAAVPAPAPAPVPDPVPDPAPVQAAVLTLDDFDC